jgi:protoheme IX farnesyltransferase
MKTTMKTTAISVPHLPLISQSRLAPDFVALMKPRVMVLAVFTACVGMMIAPSRVDPLLAFVAILAIAAGAGAAGVTTYPGSGDRLRGSAYRTYCVG